MGRQGWNEEDTYKVQDATSWGGFSGRAVNPDGSPGGIASGAASDVNRYRGLGQAAANQKAYQNDWGKADGYAGQAQGARGAQGLALGLQAQAAMGQAPSAAQSLSRNMLDQSLNAQMAGAASARGGSLAQAAAMRGASQQAAGMQMQGANQIGAMRAQEMAQARGEFMAGASGIRGQDFQAQGLAQQQQGANMQSELAQRQLNQQGQMGYEQMGYNVNAAQQQAALQKAQLDQNQAQYEKTQAFNRQEKSDDRAYGVVGSVIGGIGGFLSDARTKDPIGLTGAPVGYAASRAGGAGAMSFSPEMPSIPTLAPGSADWAKYGAPTSQEKAWAPVAATTQAPVAGVTGDPRAAAGLKGFASMSDMRAKKPVSDAEAVRLSAVADKAFAGTAADTSGAKGSLAAALSQAQALAKTKPAIDGSQGRATMADAARAMQASPYAYKPGMEPPEQEPGEPNVGPMAQNMAQNPVTATAVKKDPRSGLLMIDQGKMTKVLGGVVADQQNQIDGLAAMVAKKGGR